MNEWEHKQELRKTCEHKEAECCWIGDRRRNMLCPKCDYFWQEKL